MLRFGVPERGKWPAGVLEAVAGFRQGDVVPDLPMFYLADPARPVFARTRVYADRGFSEETVIELSEAAPYGLVLTQTCDLAQEGAKKPNSAWVHLSPIFNALSPNPTDTTKHQLDGGQRKLIKEGRDQFRLHIPALASGFWYVELTIKVPVERGWLASKAPIDGFGGDEAAREQVGRRVAWLYSRPAFDTRFVQAVQQPTLHALRELRARDRTTYERMHRQILEVGVTLNSRLEVGVVEVAVLHNGADADIIDWWQSLWDTWKAQSDALDFVLLPFRHESLAVLTAGEYRKMTRLPLAAISNEPAWYGVEPEALPGVKPA